MRFTLISEDSVVTWDGGKVSGVPASAVSDAEDALREPYASATPTGPWFLAGTPEHAWIVLRTREPQAEVAGDIPDFGDLGDELPRDEPIEEAYVERLHPRDRRGRWRDIPDYVKSLKLSGVHLVGGAVRDELLGQPHKDADFLVLGHDTDDIRQTLEPHGRVEDLVVADKPVGVRFYPHDTDARDLAPEGIEFVPPRTERSTGAGHTDFEIVADKTVPFDEDARRRDFTVNAIAKSIDTDELLDPLGGADDARAGLLRVIGPRSFQEDPLRIVRGLRFISQHDLDPTPDTLDQMHEHAPGVEHLSGERIGGEMNKLLMGKDPAKALRIARDTGVLPYLLPELTPTLGFDQGSKYHGLTADEHIFEVVQAMADQGAPLTVRWAGLLHDSGKPESAWLGGDGRLHYYANEAEGKRGHEEIGAEKAASALDRFAHLERRDRDRVIEIVREHMFRDHDSPREIKARQFLAKHGEPLALDLLAMKRADIAGKETDDDERITAELQKLARFRDTVEGQLEAGVPYRIRDLAITGHDLMALGYKPGPGLGQALEHLKQQVIGNPSLNTPDWLRAEAARRLKKLGVQEAEFEEHLHPRDRTGKWIRKGAHVSFMHLGKSRRGTVLWVVPAGESLRRANLPEKSEQPMVRVQTGTQGKRSRIVDLFPGEVHVEREPEEWTSTPDLPAHYVEGYVRPDGFEVGGYERVPPLRGLAVETNDQDVQRAVSAVSRLLDLDLSRKGEPVTVSDDESISSEGSYSIGGHISAYPAHEDQYYEPPSLGPKVTSSIVHEIGHAIDHIRFGDGSLAFGTTGRKRSDFMGKVAAAQHDAQNDYGRVDLREIMRSDLAEDEGLRRVLEAAYESSAIKEIAGYVNEPRSYTHPERIHKRPDGTEFKVGASTSREYRPHLVYLLRPDEIFARAFAQWVMLRSGDDAMNREFAQQRSRMLRTGKPDHFYTPAQWDDDDFEPVGKAMDALMEEQGWLR